MITLSKDLYAVQFLVLSLFFCRMVSGHTISPFRPTNKAETLGVVALKTISRMIDGFNSKSHSFIRKKM